MKRVMRLSGEAVEGRLAAMLGWLERLADLHRDMARVLSPGSVLRRDEPMSRRTTLRVGGPADLYVEPATEKDLGEALGLARAQGVPVLVLGRGSNLLVRDGGLRAMVVSLAQPAFSRIEAAEGRLRCGAGATLRQVAMAARDAGLGGMEFLEGIPGSVGGALRMNAGAMGGWMFDVVETLRWMDEQGQVHEVAGGEAGAQYRGCPLLRGRVALGAVLRGVASGRAEIEARLAESNRKRWTTQPRQPSAGCTFKNPRPDLPAGRLIDELGLKGMRVGDAMVSDVHGNFLVNLGGAKAADVLELVRRVSERAWAERGVELEPEVEIVGEEEASE